MRNKKITGKKFSFSSVTSNRVFLLIASALWLFSFSALFISPIHGYADNGDFWRLMEASGIKYSTQPPRYTDVISKLNLTDTQLEVADTSAVLPVLFARVLSFPFSENFDLRLLGFVHWIIAFLGTFMLARLWKAPLILLFSWIFVDPNYFLNFNSFFSEAFFISLLPWVLWSIYFPWRNPKATLGICFLIGVLAGLTKAQYLAVPAIAAVAVWFGYGKAKKMAALGFGVAFLVALIFFNSDIVPQSIKRMRAHQATFYGVAKIASDPNKTLEFLGVPERFFKLAGVDFLKAHEGNNWDPSLHDYLDHFSRFKLIGAYLLDPAAILRSAGEVQEGLTVSRLRYLGNFDESEHRPGENYFWSWQFSNLTEGIFTTIPWLVWLIPVLGFACFFLKRRGNPFLPVLIFLVLHFWTQLPIAVLGDGFFSTNRHLIGARLASSLILIVFLNLKGKHA
jgi:hypothetical protein